MHTMVKKKTKSKPNRVRVPLELSPKAAERLDALCADAGHISRSEALRQALQIYEWAVREHKDGQKFFKGASLTDAAEVVLFRW